MVVETSFWTPLKKVTKCKILSWSRRQRILFCVKNNKITLVICLVKFKIIWKKIMLIIWTLSRAWEQPIRVKHYFRGKWVTIIKWTCPPVRLTTSKLPGATIRLSMTLLIFVTRDRMDDFVHERRRVLWIKATEKEILCICSFSWAANVSRRTCSAGVGLRSWFLFRRHSLKAVSSGAGFTRGKAISHWQHTHSIVYYITNIAHGIFRDSLCLSQLP